MTVSNELGSTHSLLRQRRNWFLDVDSLFPIWLTLWIGVPCMETPTYHGNSSWR